MLLILESKCLYNDKVMELIDSVLEKYYIDFNKNETFHPMFLVNDIIRFWRTLCLNYEYSRNRTASSDEQKIKACIKNYKLKFSRKLTCHSLLLNILFSQNKNLTKEEIKDFIKLTPLEMLHKIKEDNSRNNEITSEINKLRGLCNNFLTITRKSKEELETYFAETNNKDEAFKNARFFSQSIFNLMMKKKDDKKLQYFLIYEIFFCC